MKLISCLLIFFFIQMHSAKHRSKTPNIIRIPLKTIDTYMKKHTSAQARTRIILDDGPSTVTTISIGTPKQDFLMKFDTGSGDVWAYSTNYDSCGPGSEIVFNDHGTYSSIESSTYQRVLNPRKNSVAKLMVYALQWVFGFKAIDTITIANNEFKIEFVEVTRTTEKRVQQKIDGIIGLRYDPKEGNIVTKFCDKMKKEHKFSYYLPKVKAAGVGGELTLCEEDNSKYITSTMKYYDDTSSGRWFVSLDSVTVDDPKGTITLSSQSKAVLDTGSNRIAGPEGNLTQFFNAVNSSIIGNPKQQEVNCQNINLLPNVTFNIGGTKYTFTSLDYIVKLGRRVRCFIGILPISTGQWLLGEPFFRKYYTVFDIKNRKIGIAQSKG